MHVIDKSMLNFKIYSSIYFFIANISIVIFCIAKVLFYLYMLRTCQHKKQTGGDTLYKKDSKYRMVHTSQEP